MSSTIVSKDFYTNFDEKSQQGHQEPHPQGVQQEGDL